MHLTPPRKSSCLVLSIDNDDGVWNNLHLIILFRMNIIMADVHKVGNQSLLSMPIYFINLRFFMDNL